MAKQTAKSAATDIQKLLDPQGYRKRRLRPIDIRGSSAWPEG